MTIIVQIPLTIICNLNYCYTGGFNPAAAGTETMNHLSLANELSVPELPEDVFLLIIEGLKAWDICRCRKVSRSWRKAFGKEEYLKIVLKKHLLSREVRCLLQAECDRPEVTIDQYCLPIRDTFDIVASRYYHLTHGKAKSISKYKLIASEQFSHWYPVSQWDYHESQPGGRLYYENATHISRLGGKPYLFRPTFWTYDNGLVVFAPEDRADVGIPCGKGKHVTTSWTLVILDLESGLLHPVPFATDDRVIRNLRLRERTLIVEWAEKQPFHSLNESEQVHRHFATCFDVCSSSDEMDRLNRSWRVVFRNEWKMHFLGLPLNHRDRFFSTHSSQHYAVYFWQPNRSMYTGDEELPIESLFVWDIATPSSYLPSTDPTGKAASTHRSGPSIRCRLVLDQLDHLGIRQHSEINLMSLHVDSPTCSIMLRENICVAGQGYFDPAQRLWCAKTIAFPFVGEGPHLYREWDGNLPPYRGHVSMESADVEDPEQWFLPIMDVVDEIANVRFSVVQTCFTGHFKNSRIVRVKAMGKIATMQERLAEEIACMGKIAGDERWLVGQNERMEIVVLKF